MLDIASISAIVATAGVLIAVVYYILDMRNQRLVRQTDLIMKLYSRYGSEAFQKSMDKLRQRDLKDLDYLQKHSFAEWVAVGTFFEGVGILLHRKLRDIGLVDDLFTAPVNMAWDMMKDSIIEVRKQYGQPTIFEWFEDLYNELKKREQKLKTS